MSNHLEVQDVIELLQKFDPSTPVILRVDGGEYAISEIKRHGRILAVVIIGEEI
jgi:hypothetical protein